MSRPDAADGLPLQQAATVLIADDDRSIAALVAAVVADLGYRPVIAHDGQQALELTRELWPVLLITDLMMPRLNGRQVIAGVHRAAAETGRAPVPTLLMTAADPLHRQASGADAVLLKPFDLDDLEDLVLQLLQREQPDGGTQA